MTDKAHSEQLQFEGVHTSSATCLPDRCAARYFHFEMTVTGIQTESPATTV